MVGFFSILQIIWKHPKKIQLQSVTKYVGIACLLLGIWGIISCIINLDMLSEKILIWVTRLIVSIELATLGVLLRLIKKPDILFKSFLVTMSIIAIGLGLCQIIISAISWPYAIIY